MNQCWVEEIAKQKCDVSACAVDAVVQSAVLCRDDNPPEYEVQMFDAIHNDSLLMNQPYFLEFAVVVVVDVVVVVVVVAAAAASLDSNFDPVSSTFCRNSHHCDLAPNTFRRRAKEMIVCKV
jgi:hypothetical protein